MNDARWYPTTTTLPGGGSGDALVIAGEINSNNNGNYNNMPQKWQGGNWISLNSLMGLQYYPYTFVAPNGKVFVAGPVRQTRYLDTSDTFTGNNRWQAVANHISTVAHNWASAVMYEPGKVLVMGGIDCTWYPGPSQSCTPPVATAEIINLPPASPSPALSPAWSPAANMIHARKLHNATLLPNGNVFVSGGSSGPESPNTVPSPAYRVSPCEMWKPPSSGSPQGQWSLRADLPRYRGYHSIALLLPDGRVLSAGGDGGNGLNSSASAEIYSPEYLFDSNDHALLPSQRPAITSASPNPIHYTSPNNTLTIKYTTPTNSSISRVTMLAPGSVTHGFNMGQRFIDLGPFSSPSPGTLTVKAPSSPNLAPPGYYMLFILTNTGVPSVAHFIQLQQ